MWTVIDLQDRATWPPYTAAWVLHVWRDEDGDVYPGLTQARRLATALEMYSQDGGKAAGQRQDWSWRRMDYPWKARSRTSERSPTSFTADQVSAMRQVARLWGYPGMVAPATLREIVELMAAGTDGHEEAGFLTSGPEEEYCD